MKLTRKQIIIIASIAVAIIVIGIVISLVVNRGSSDNNALTGSGGMETTNQLEYQTILPTGRTIEDLGGWRRVSPEGTAPVYAYNDRLENTSINVSQQPLPDAFIGDSDTQVAELAERFNARSTIDAAGTVVYIGSSSNGPQSVIFTKNSLLVLIKSDDAIENTAWQRYIESLR